MQKDFVLANEQALFKKENARDSLKSRKAQIVILHKASVEVVLSNQKVWKLFQRCWQSFWKGERKKWSRIFFEAKEGSWNTTSVLNTE